MSVERGASKAPGSGASAGASVPRTILQDDLVTVGRSGWGPVEAAIVAPVHAQPPQQEGEPQGARGRRQGRRGRGNEWTHRGVKMWGGSAGSPGFGMHFADRRTFVCTQPMSIHKTPTLLRRLPVCLLPSTGSAQENNANPTPVVPGTRSPFRMGLALPAVDGVDGCP